MFSFNKSVKALKVNELYVKVDIHACILFTHHVIHITIPPYTLIKSAYDIYTML